MRTYDITKTQQDLRRLSWTCPVFTSEITKSSTASRNLSREPSVVVEGTAAATVGNRLACREGTGRYETTYVLSSYDAERGIYGRECVAELIGARIANALNIPAVHPRLVHALVQMDGLEHDTWLSTFRTYRAPGERAATFGSYFDLHRHPGETVAAFCERFGWLPTVQNLLLLDDLAGNEARTVSDVDVLADAEGAVRLSPAHGFGSATFGGVFADEGRGRMPEPMRPLDDGSLHSAAAEARAALDDSLLVAGRDAIMAGMSDVLSDAECDAIWEHIRGRWCA